MTAAPPPSPRVAFGLMALAEACKLRLGRRRAAECAETLRRAARAFDLGGRRGAILAAIDRLERAPDASPAEAGAAADALLTALRDEAGGLEIGAMRAAETQATLAAAGAADWQRRADVA